MGSTDAGTREQGLRFEDAGIFAGYGSTSSYPGGNVSASAERSPCWRFARLFWHFDWHKKHGDGRGFYAVLDESTASLDVESEVAVYKQCQVKGMGFLSVAHRPTVIKYHTKARSA